MSPTDFATLTPDTIKVWHNILWEEARRESFLTRFAPELFVPLSPEEQQRREAQEYVERLRLADELVRQRWTAPAR